MKQWILAAAAVLSAGQIAQPAFAGDKSVLSLMPAEIIDCQAHDDALETADAKLAETAMGFLQNRDVTALRTMQPQLEAAGSHAPDKPSLPEKCGSTLIIYGGGLGELLMATALTQKPELGIDKVEQREALPYARLHLLIGWLYVEQGNLEKADHWLTRGLKNDPHDSLLASEYANTLSQTGRSAEALAFVDTFLAENEDLGDDVRAVLLRRRGYALGELGRHDEAIAAFRASLKLAPGNEGALSEIEWNRGEKKRKKKQ
jgi:tetratricopeptide (TPR) repeat protein